MIKRGDFNRFPKKGGNLPKQFNHFPNNNSLPKQFNHFPNKGSNISKNNITKYSLGLSKSTKTLLIAVIAIVCVVILFFIIRGIINGNKDDIHVDKLTADLKISEVQIVNYTDINFKVEGDMSEGDVDSISFVIYGEDDSVIIRKKMFVNDLEENYFYINLHVTNTSKIKDITVTPTFVNEEGKKVIGEVEDTYSLSDEERYNYNREDGLYEEETPSCILDYECDDSNACTEDVCYGGECSHADISECIPCKYSSECEDSITCTTNTCSNGKCSYLSIPGCDSCGSNLDCDDYNSCTENICSGGRCLYTPMESCVSCSLDSECEDNDICTENICSNGACSYFGMSGCKNCSSVSDCDDNELSTKDVCLNNKCEYTEITSCINGDNYCPDGCTVGNDNDCVYSPFCGDGIREGDEKCDLSAFGGATCAGVLGVGYTGTLRCTKICTFNTSLCAPPCKCSNDNNICTADGCVNNVCQHVPLTGNSCTSDNNVCTNDVCSSTGTCKHISLTGNSCTDDNNVCTNDICSSNGVCTHPAIPGCCLSNAQCTSGKTCVNNACVDSSIPPPTGDFYYVSPSGSDSNGDGSISKPWFSLNKAWSYVGAGDTIYMRGGNYKYTKQTLEGRSGSDGKTINVFAYPGEKPIITKSSSYSAQWPRALILVRGGSYLHFKGLEISYFEQEDKEVWAGLWAIDTENSIFEQLDIHHCGAGGIFENTDKCLILNSDFHHNSDPLTGDKYGNADGTGTVGDDPSHVNIYRGCRSWWNTDDGYDPYGDEGNVIFENCWAWYNGFIPDTFNDGGDGNGFKFGGTNTNLPNTVLRTATNCLSFYNEGWGFLDNGAQCNMKIYNNIAYQNCYHGLKGGWCGGFHFNLVPGIPYYVKNNIAYENTKYDSNANEVEFDVLTNVNHNSWDSSVSVSDADFLSVDLSCMDDSRKADGSLPDCNFLKLKQGSDLINKGVNVGLPYSGSAPDLGAFEYGSSTSICTDTCSSLGYNCGTKIICGVSKSCGTCSGTCTNNVCVTSSTPQPTPIPNSNCINRKKDGSETGIDCGGNCDACPVSGRTYYVATTGSDSNSGTFEKPWKTWQKGFDSLSAGDLLYIRGGVYETIGYYSSGGWNGVYLYDKSGAEDEPIRVFAYPGERPILDCNRMSADSLHTGITFEGSNYWHLKGLTVRNVPDTQSVSWGAIGFYLYESDDNLFENCVSHDNEGPGFAIGGDNNLFLNCDSYNNYDYNVGGENADGFVIGNVDYRYTNTFRGCRSWHNSDDGYDTFGYEGTAIYENCWSFDNGAYGSSNGDGAGFKLGITSFDALSTPQRVYTNCIAAKNKESGFDESQDPGSLPHINHVYNSISYNNYGGFNFGYGGSPTDTIRNSISYNDRVLGNFGSNTVDHNSWQNGLVVSDSDFLSLDVYQLYSPRESDGSLPKNVTFGHLASTSDLINKGVNVGLPYKGNAPDLGAFETNY